MNISIAAIQSLLTQKFIENDYEKEIALSMSAALVRSELFGRTTHGLTRYNWILQNNIFNKADYNRNTLTENIISIDCEGLNGYHVARKEVDQLCSYHTENKGFQISILQDIFPTNAYIDYLEIFQKNNIGAIIVGTTPRLVGVRDSGKRIVGTNPIGYTFPNDKKIIISDLSTSHIPLGRILQNSKEKNKQQEVLNDLGKIISASKALDENNIFTGALLPFGGIQAEHKGFNISLLIEFLTASLCGKRSTNGDMIMVTFHKDYPAYKIDGVNSMLDDIFSIDTSIRTPGQKSIDIYYSNIKRGYIDVNKNILDTLSVSTSEISKIKYEG